MIRALALHWLFLALLLFGYDRKGPGGQAGWTLMADAAKFRLVPPNVTCEWTLSSSESKLVIFIEDITEEASLHTLQVCRPGPSSF